MINFFQLVTLMLEAAPTSAKFSVFYNDNTISELNKVRTFFADSFDITTWPDSNGLFPILADLYSRQRAEGLIPFAEYFPLIDFIWYVVDRNSVAPAKAPEILIDATAKNLIIANIQKLANDFLSNCSTLNPPGGKKDPVFGYVPVTGKAIQYLPILKKKLANSAVGKLALQTFDRFSIRKALYGLLQTHKKIKTLMSKVKGIPNDNLYIDGILMNPQKFITSKQIPPELRKYYDDVSGKVIVDIAILIHDFFESEYSLSTGASPDNNETMKQFVQFISNEPLTGPAKNFAFLDARKNSKTSPSVSGLSGGYTIANIKQIGTPQAKDLINKLQEFGDFISEGEPKEWFEKGIKKLQQATGVVSGLSLGAKNIGT